MASHEHKHPCPPLPTIDDPLVGTVDMTPVATLFGAWIDLCSVCIREGREALIDKDSSAPLLHAAILAVWIGYHIPRSVLSTLPLLPTEGLDEPVGHLVTSLCDEEACSELSTLHEQISRLTRVQRSDLLNYCLHTLLPQERLLPAVSQLLA